MLIRRLLAILVLAVVLPAQGAEPPANDPLGRTTPQDTVYQFLEACHARQYSKAAHYLDLRQMPTGDRDKNGQDLARQLEDLLDDTPFEIATLSRNPEGDLTDGLALSREQLATFQLDGKPLALELERVELKPGLKVWLLSADSIPLIPKAHQLLAEPPLEKKLPQVLVTHEILDTPLLRWIALLAIGLLVWFAAGLIARAIVLICGRLMSTN